MRILFCTDGIYPHAIGGMQRHSRLLVEALAALPDVELIVLHPHSTTIFDHPSITEKCLPPINPRKNYLLECYRYSKRVAHIANAYPNHIIYSQGLSVWHRAKTFSNRWVTNPHGLEPFQCLTLRDRLIALPFKFAFRHIFKHATRVVSLGGKLTDILAAIVPKNRLVVLPNAVNLPKLALKQPMHNPDSRLRVFFLARFAHNKGIHILLQAVEALNNEGHASRFDFYLGGKGPLYESIKKSGVPENVHLLGFLEDEAIHNEFLNADAFVLPTLFEGMPTVVLEAMSFRLPVIATDVGAMAELVDHENGWLIPRNNVGALKDALLHLLRLPHVERSSMGDSSLAKVRSRFTWSKVASDHVQVFRSLAQA